MVATRFTEIIDPNNTVEARLERIQTAMDQINESIRGLLLFQQFATNEINNLKAGEGTSNRGGGGSSQYGRLTKLEFHKFNGEDVQGWLYKIHQFFLLDGINDAAERIRLVSMHVFDKALNWHKQFIKRFGENVTWERYETEVKGRFNSVFEDPMVELKNLRQTTSVHIYQDLFKSLMNKVELTESYDISMFIGRLKEEISLAVKMFKPTNLPDVYCLAKMQDATIAVSKGRSASLLATPRTNTVGGVVNRSVGAKDEDMQLTKEGVMSTFTTSLIDKPPLISLNALYGENSYRIMRVRAYVRKNMVHTLTDCGSTHNFLDWNTDRKLGCRLRKICQLEVSVANGHVMNSLYECKDFYWELQGITYTSDVMILPLRGCEMVLGIQWLSTLGWIRCDFRNLVMEYTYNNRKIVLKGTQQATIQWMQGKPKKKGKFVTTELSAMSVCVCPATLMQMEAKNSHSKEVEILLEEFKSVFEMPKNLPPKRTHDHRISLVLNTHSVNVRPYKHPPSQKDAVELMVKELLESGVIRNSQSPFSSPIVMVKKKDGT
ncbi:reverse transcriptase [Tanacetum coccineum]|uniref:Reverse transcriptase n=1 Tax=Tanacetum coccineum TaxID=301880 RepID=A0ABQ4YTK8_9ASTR